MPTENSKNSKVLVVLDRGHAEALLPESVGIGAEPRRKANAAVRRALDAEQEERREYRVFGVDDFEGRAREFVPTTDLESAKRGLAQCLMPPEGPPLVVQVRTITQLKDGQFVSKWRDLEEGES